MIESHSCSDIDERGVGMKFRITDHCVKCGACAMDCPTQCITQLPLQFYIGAGCIGCGDCYEICPVGAIEIVEDDAIEGIDTPKSEECNKASD